MTQAKAAAGRIAEAFNRLFSKRSANASARKEKFSRRAPKQLDGFGFLVAMTLGRFKKSAQ
jgi:hypothetical protein